MPSLRLKYMIEDYGEIIANLAQSSPSLKIQYLVPDYREFARHFDRLQIVKQD